MKMAIMFNCLNCFRDTRISVMKLYVMCFLVLCAYVLVHICYHTEIYVQLSYWQGLELHPKINCISRKLTTSHDYNKNEENNVNQAVEKSDCVNETKNFSNVIDENQPLHKEHNYVRQANNLFIQKEFSWQKTKLSVDMKSKQKNTRDIGINTTHINRILMEPVNVNYTRNIYFTVKTTHKYYTNRLFPLMLTWLQAVDKNKLSIITDRSTEKNVHVNVIRKSGFNLVDTSCLAAYVESALSCKLPYEFDAYYKSVEEHPGEEHNYQWFCHIDDDMYVNVFHLSQFLQLYDPHKPYYIGKWPPIRLRRGFSNLYEVPLKHKTMQLFSHKTKYTLKQTSYRYATGAAYCISYDLMMKAKEYFDSKTFQMIAKEAKTSADDMTVGFIIAALLGYDLTDAPILINQYDTYVESCSLQTLIKYPTVSSAIIQNDSLERLVASLKTPLPPDPTKFMLYHCLLYPNVSWCEGIREIFNELKL